MGVLSDNAIIGASAAGGYDIDYSCRFNPGDSPQLTRTPTSVGNRQIYTISAWAKVCDEKIALLEAFTDTNNLTAFYIDVASFRIYGRDSGDDIYWNSAGGGYLTRDPAAWYHFCIAVDLTESSASDMIKVWVNNELMINWGTQTGPPASYSSDINNTIQHYIGSVRQNTATRVYPEQYLAEYHLIDGQALTPSSFAETDEDTNQWIPKKYAGAYGTNGFYLKFEDAADLGNDSSGNGNDFTPSGLTANDQMLDTPTNNFCVFNNIAIWNGTVQEGNLKTNGNQEYCGTMAYPDTGKWYYEVCFVTDNASYEGYVGVGASTDLRNASWVYGNYGILLCKDDGTASTRAFGGIGSVGSNTGTGSQWVDGDVLQVLVDLDSTPNTFQVKKNNGGTALVAYEFTWAGIDFGPYGGILFPMLYTNNAAIKMVANFGQDSSFAANKTAQGNSDSNAQGDFYYEPPAGYLALCSNNLVTNASISDPGKFFKTHLYTGDGSTNNPQTGIGFQPDLVWIKDRQSTSPNVLVDSMRGVGKCLFSNSTVLEENRINSVSSFDSDGFTVKNDSYTNATNNFVAWCWKANGGTPVTNDEGNITTSISANTTAGFVIGTYTGESSSGTLGHGLTKAPEFVIIKRRDGTGNWITYHGAVGANYSFSLNTDGGSSASGWSGNTRPTSTLIHVANNSDVNGNTYTYVFYAWHSVPGLTKVGTYYGGYDVSAPYNQNFCPTGFRPAFVLIKKDAGSAAWQLFDDQRLGYNIDNDQLYPNDTAVEGTSDFIDIVSNGFKVRTNNSVVGAVATYDYIAFASNTFEGANAR